MIPTITRSKTLILESDVITGLEKPKTKRPITTTHKPKNLYICLR